MWHAKAKIYCAKASIPPRYISVSMLKYDTEGMAILWLQQRDLTEYSYLCSH